MIKQRTLLLLGALILFSCAAHAGRSRVFLGGSGSTIVLAVGNYIYKPVGEGRMERLVNVARPAITAMTAGPDGVFAAVGRSLYGGNIDGSNMRPMGNAPAESITSLADSNGILYGASGDTIYQTPVHTDAAPTIYARIPGNIKAIYAASEGVYAAVGKTLWRVKGSERDKVAEAPSPIMAVAGGSRNVYYAYHSGNGVEIASPGGSSRWAISGIKEVDGLYFDAARNVMHYTWSDAKGAHYQDLSLSATP